MALTWNNKSFWTEFIDLYKNLPALWKVKSTCYNNRSLKSQGYDILVKKFKEIYTDADRDIVKRKINTLRGCYRKELKKIEESQKDVAFTNEEPYIPTLWYFKNIDFLRYQDTEADVEEMCAVDYYEENVKEESNDNDTEKMADQSDSDTTSYKMNYNYDKVKFNSEFIDLYRTLPALWQYKSKEYRNKRLKAIAYEKLVKKIREIEPSGNRDTAIRRIHTLRTGYRKELKKIRSENELGNNYEPTLWYFDKFSFLEEQDTPPNTNHSNMDEDNDISTHVIKRQKLNHSPVERPNRSSFISNENDLSDEYNIMGKRFACQLSSLDEYQRTCAEKLISDIIFYGKLGRLTEYSTLQIATLPRQFMTVNPNND